MRPGRRPAAQGFHSYPSTHEANALAKVGARGGVARAASGPTGVVGPPVRMCGTGAAGGSGVDSIRTRFAGAGADRGATVAAAASVVAFSNSSFMGVIRRRPRACHIRARARRGACSGHGAPRSPSTGFERPAKRSWTASRNAAATARRPRSPPRRASRSSRQRGRAARGRAARGSGARVRAAAAARRSGCNLKVRDGVWVPGGACSTDLGRARAPWGERRPSRKTGQPPSVARRPL